jgi:hypothetical protein
MLTADTITDEQIRELRELSSEYGEGFSIGDEYYAATIMLVVCDEALGDFDYGETFANLPMAKALQLVEERRLWSRGHCAQILNERKAP